MLIPNSARHPNLSLSPACNKHCTEVFQPATKSSQPPLRYTMSFPPTPSFPHLLSSCIQARFTINFPHMLWERRTIVGFFWWWWGIILFVCFPKPVGRGWGKPVQVCSSTAVSSHLPKWHIAWGHWWNTWASAWLHKMPLKLPGQE